MTTHKPNGMFKVLLTVRSANDDTRRRGGVIIAVSLLLCGLLLVIIPMIVFSGTPPGSSRVGLTIAIAAIGGTIWLARSGRVTLSAIALVGLMLLALTVPPVLRRDVSVASVFLVLPVLVAGVVLRPWQIWLAVLAALACIALVFSRAPALLASDDGRLLAFTVPVIIIFAGAVSFLSALIVHGAFVNAAEARQHAEGAAAELAQSNATLEGVVAERTLALRTTLDDLEQRVVEKQNLLDEVAQQRDLIREMSLPVLPVTATTLVMPLVGALDTARLAQLQERALAAVEAHHATRLLLDVTGVLAVDSHVAMGLFETVQATRLLGASTVLIGVRPEVAQAMVAMGLDFSAVRTARDLASAL